MIDTMRHDEYFDKTKFVLPVHIVGCGGVGSHIAELIAKLGVGFADTSTVNLWDGDSVAKHNLANQAFCESHIGLKKAGCLKTQYAKWSGGIKPISHEQYVTEKIPLSGIVFLAVDSMAARRKICQESIWSNPEVKLLIEVRMDATYVIVHTINPNNQSHIEIWEEEWYPDNETENSVGCGGHITVITTVVMAASLAVQKLLAFDRSENPAQKLTFNIPKGELKEYYW